MPILNKNSTNYVHPEEPNLVNVHKAMQYNDAGEPELRTHVHGITLEGNVIVDKVRVEVDTLHNTIDADHPVPVYYPTTPTVKLDSTTLTALETTTVNQGAHWFIKKYNAATSSWITQSTQLFATPEAALATLDPTGGGINIASGAVYVKFNDDEGTPAEASFKAYYRANVGPTKVTTAPIGSGTLTAGTNTFTLAESVVGSANPNAPVTITFTAAGNQTDSSTLAAALTASLSNSKVSAVLNTDKTITLSHNAGGEIRFVDGTNAPLAALFGGSPANLYPAPSGVSGSYVASNWSATVVDDLGNTVGFAGASATAPVTTPLDGRLWYNSMIDEVDIMIHDGTTWVGYHNGDIPALNGPADRKSTRLNSSHT